MDMEVFLKEFGKRVRYYRKLKGYSQEYLASLVGVSTNSVAAWERGEAFIRKTVLKNLCKTLEIIPQDLFSHKIQKLEAEEGSTLLEIFNVAKDLSISKQKQVLTILKTFK